MGSESQTASTIYNEITRDYVSIVLREAVWTFENTKKECLLLAIYSVWVKNRMA